MKVSEIKLGQRVRDRVSGLQGIVVFHTKFLNGCHQLGVHPEELHGGQPIDPTQVDIQQLELIDDGLNDIEQEEVGGMSPIKTKFRGY